MDKQMQAIHQSRKKVGEVRQCLLEPTPESLTSCQLPLGEAIDALQRLEADLRKGSSHGPELRAEIRSLRSELGMVSALLKSAGIFYEGYGALLGLGPEPVEIDYGSGHGSGWRNTGLALERPVIVIHG